VKLGISAQASPLEHDGFFGSQSFRHAPGGAPVEEKQVRPGLHSTAVLQALPSTIVPAGQMQSRYWPLTR
jgi:hypothetical protein